MAKLFKMTLYVCDLEEDLSLDDIKVLIDERALNGVAVSCITHYADEQEDPEIEFSDDIDINYCDSTAAQWDKYFEGE